MKAVVRISALLGSAVTLASAQAPAAAAPGGNPVSNVVKLLQTMQTELSNEAKADQSAYDKIKCWCAASTKTQKQVIADELARLAASGSSSDGAAAASVRLQEEIKNLKKELANSKDSLETQSLLRQKQAASFTAEVQDMENSITALASAIAVLTRNSSQSFLGLAEHNPFVVVSEELKKHSTVLNAAITPSQRRLIMTLSQSSNFKSVYTPQSGEILGVLKQMKETFESNLADARKAEASAAQQFADLQAAKTSEISATADSISQKQVQLAQAGDSAAKSKQDVQDTHKANVADISLLQDVSNTCSGFDSEFQTRNQLRNAETLAIAQALALLNNDLAHGTVGRVFKAVSFLQVSQQPAAGALQAAAALLNDAAQQTSDARLAAVATKAKTLDFSIVTGAIDKLIQELTAESAAELKQKESCSARTNDNTLFVQQFTKDGADASSRVQAAQISIDGLTSAVTSIQTEISDLQSQLTKLKADRDAQKQAFNQIVADQQQTQGLLKQAIAVLSSAYQTPAASFLQQPQNQTASGAPAGFEAYGAGRTPGSQVIALLQKILDDAVALQKDATSAEQQAQSDFDKVFAASTAAIASKQQSIVDKNEAKAQAQQQLLNAQQDASANQAQLSTLQQTAQAIQLECQTLLQNFDIRQSARAAEVNALSQAKGILAANSVQAPAKAVSQVPVAASPASAMM